MRRRNIFCLCIATIITFVVFHGTLLFAGSAPLSWTPPTTNTDGTHLTDLAGYKIYYGTSSGNYSQNINVGNVTTYTVSNLTSGTYYFSVTAYNTSAYESAYSNQLIKTIQSQTGQLYTLAITKGGTGSGTVTSSRTGINCGSTCSASYNRVRTITLTSTPGSGSTFSGWSGACAGNGPQCTLSINTNTSATAHFVPQSAVCTNQPVRIARTTPRYYSSIQAAYNAAQEGDIIQIQGAVLTGDVHINRNISVTLHGGYDCNFSTYLQNTLINGIMTIYGGSLSAEHIEIE